MSIVKKIVLLSCFIFIVFKPVYGAPIDSELRRAILNNDTVMMQNAIDKGADVNHIDINYTDSPLSFAIMGENLETIEFLLKNNANPNVSIDGNGFYTTTPLIKAINAQNTKIVNLLLIYGADVNLPSHKYDDETAFGLTPLMQTIIAPYTRNSLDIFELILSKNPDVNFVNARGYTALMFTADAINYNEHKKEAMVIFAEKLLEKGANKFIRNNDGLTALDLANNSNFTKMIHLFEGV